MSVPKGLVFLEKTNSVIGMKMTASLGAVDAGVRLAPQFLHVSQGASKLFLKSDAPSASAETQRKKSAVTVS
mgnify:CR=1 FL=1